MGRQDRRKTRRHGVAAHSKASLIPQKAQKTDDTLGTAAVAATFTTEPEDDDENDATEFSSELQSLSRGQRKRLKRRAAFMRKMGMVSRVKSQEQTKSAPKDVFTDLQELENSLFQVTADENKRQSSSKTKKQKPLSGRQRQKLAVRELGQLKAVQAHESFQNDPFAAIQAHLQHTVVQANEELIQKTIARKKKSATTMIDE